MRALFATVPIRGRFFYAPFDGVSVAGERGTRFARLFIVVMPVSLGGAVIESDRAIRSGVLSIVASSRRLSQQCGFVHLK